MKKVLTILGICALMATPSYAWTVRTATVKPNPDVVGRGAASAPAKCEFFGGSHLAVISDATVELFNGVWNIIPHATETGEGLFSKLSLVAPFDFVGSFGCVAFSERPSVAAAAVVSECPTCPSLDCRQCLVESLKK